MHRFFTVFPKCRMRLAMFAITILNLVLSEQIYTQPFYENAGWTDIGSLTYTAFGWSMSNAGDVNGDGFDDMVVTAIDYSNPPDTNGEEGQISLYYGGPAGLSAEPVWQYESDNDSSVLGFSSDGGDLNGDGFSDIVIGCLQWTGDQYNEGRIYLWYGSATGLSDSGPDWTLEFDQTFALLGSGVAMSGDINNDGFNDLFVSAKMWDGPEEDEGKTWLYWGSPSGPVESGWSWEPNQAGAISGFPVSYAGDVNSDGYDDVLIGANQFDDVVVDDGLAVAFYGSAAGLNTTPDWQASSGQKKSNFGHWVDGAGDVNGDGYDDVIIAALLYESDSLEISEGRLFVYHGGPDGLSPTYNWFGEINQIAANLGYSCAGAGDINGDGYDDVIGGAKYYSNGEYQEGGAFVWFGSETGLKYDYCWKGEGNQALGYYGRHVGGDADFNNDGYSDFMVGAYRYTTILEADGKGFVYYGAPQEAQFHYAEDTFCIEDEMPIAIIDGLTGGSFFSDDAVVDPATGEVNLLASGGGIKTIYYQNIGFCPVDSFKIVIHDSIGGSEIFYYPSETYCSGGIDPLPVNVSGATGTFYSPDAVVDAATGSVDLSATGYGGPFTIYFEALTASGCEVLASDSIYIDYDASFYYMQDTFCIYQTNPFPVIDDIDDGTFFTYDTGIDINEDNGKLVLPLSVVGGPYTVYYNSYSTCPLDSAIVWIKDIGPADNVFSYDTDSICINEANPLPEIIPGADGFFYSSTAIVNSSTGEIDLAATGAGATHQIYFEAEEICAIDSFAITILDIDLSASVFHYESDTLCINEINPLPLIDGASGGSFYSEDAIVDSITGEVDLAATGAGLFEIQYAVIDAGGCSVASTFTLYLFDDADATIFYGDTLYYQDESNPTPAAADTTGTFSSIPDGLIFADENGTIDLILSAVGVYTIYYLVEGVVCVATDSFTIQILPPCEGPAEIVIDELTPTSVEISWSADPYYTNYLVYLVTADDTVSYNAGGVNSITITDLEPEEEYAVYVFTDCIADTSGSFAKIEFTTPVGIENLIAEKQLIVYPNPASDILFINYTGQFDITEIQLINAEGQLVLQHSIQLNPTDLIELNTGQLPAGMYLLKVVGADQCLKTHVVLYNF